MMGDGEIAGLNRLWDSVGVRLLPPPEEMEEERAADASERPQAAPSEAGDATEKTADAPEGDGLEREAALRSHYRALLRRVPGAALRRELKTLLASQEEWYARLAAAAFLRRGYVAGEMAGNAVPFDQGLRQCFLQEEALLGLYESGGGGLPEAVAALAAERKRGHLEQIARMAQMLFAGM